ncbi:MAG: hypothetical protein LBI79_01430 [Nitrososphaerota archaeon]|nr:hypothetical protein [Nitrososphaerota archaeon]
MGDIFGTLKVEKDGVIIDGAGFAIRADWYGGVMLKKNPADMVMPPSYGEVVVRNVRFCDRGIIYASTEGNSFLNNTFEGGWIETRGGMGSDEFNLIKHNVFVNAFVIFTSYSGRNIMIENNFINCSRLYIDYYGAPVEFDRNYWSDYEALYPEAKEIEGTGIWGIPYSRYGREQFNVDYNPLVNPVVGAGAPVIDDTSTPAPTSAMNDKKPEILPTALIAASVVVVAVVCIGLLVYFKRHKHSSQHHLT